MKKQYTLLPVVLALSGGVLASLACTASHQSADAGPEDAADEPRSDVLVPINPLPDVVMVVEMEGSAVVPDAGAEAAAPDAPTGTSDASDASLD